MKNAALIIGGLMILIGLFMTFTVFTAREIRDAETNRLIYGSITAIVGLVVAGVAKIIISQRK